VTFHKHEEVRAASLTDDDKKRERRALPQSARRLVIAKAGIRIAWKVTCSDATGVLGGEARPGGAV
jgi:hypothetical protein